MLSATNVFKTYKLGRVEVPVLRGVDLHVEEGEWIAILGASGSGKSTLLHLLGGLDRPDRKTKSAVTFGGRDLSVLSAGALNQYRSQSVGFVFQFYHLLPELTVLENVVIAGMVRHSWAWFAASRADVNRAARSLLDAFGLSARLRHRPAELSGGERQRVAIARALVNSPAVLLADEPTGNLDRVTGDAILDAMTEIRRKRGQTIVMVTHDPEVARRADRTVRLLDGQVVADAA
jgi:ABC-type lipoprotein export system ATPase subunit